eukprot:281125_1
MADETLSITSLTSRFPQDILQYILSFNRSCDVSSICKVFKQCDNNNTNHMNRQRMAAIDQHAFHHQIKYDESISCTYIVDPTRDHLLPHETVTYLHPKVECFEAEYECKFIQQ